MITSTTEFDRRDHDTLIRIAKDSYYGVIQKIWELNYYDFVIHVFKCKWANNHTGVQVDKDGLKLVELQLMAMYLSYSLQNMLHRFSLSKTRAR